MIAITSIAILISTIAGNSIAALTISTLLYVTYYIFDSQVHIFNKIAHFIPFTYCCNIPNIIDNTATAVYENCNITYRNGIIVLLLTTIINGTLSYLAIRKKDIL
jgi:ABC-type transport system involved in multi-copper enzyme maturation permease subunit